ncbi:transmembrane protein 6/97 [Fomitopsis serialis]|uniref:transmembrane protein 6/97 n=1 Tax=Fomitopsis serialis TaxID=139415 RepID=UPI00200810A2|nr:transmembrane protein 6/97 [Neoantrodia serialis]KAH9931876.1 transmembrane protein 6/97 [Neoantrodia serialis]
MARRPLTSRPLDLAYFSFFLMHTFATVVVDLQAIYPPHLIPSAMKGVVDYYLTTYNDPLIGGVMGFFGPAKADSFNWFETFVIMEAFFQLPSSSWACEGFTKVHSRTIYVLLLVYAASATTTTLPCLTTILATPVTPVPSADPSSISVTPAQRLSLLTSYVPFLVVPLLMTIDMGFRVLSMVRVASSTAEREKRK